MLVVPEATEISTHFIDVPGVEKQGTSVEEMADRQFLSAIVASR
jgi:hypothetical protein